MDSVSGTKNPNSFQNLRNFPFTSTAHPRRPATTPLTTIIENLAFSLLEIQKPRNEESSSNARLIKFFAFILKLCGDQIR
ncbi:hypothetical protein V6N11_026572 [Hibiscus sabdariffa]|uniref:Uncharacterized protein n=1 Tax=Hibiscus sabdariffa TaxID=183260 RepID=A0ABR2SW28_9ROSI